MQALLRLCHDRSVFNIEREHACKAKSSRFCQAILCKLNHEHAEIAQSLQAWVLTVKHEHDQREEYNREVLLGGRQRVGVQVGAQKQGCLHGYTAQ